MLKKHYTRLNRFLITEQQKLARIKSDAGEVNALKGMTPGGAVVPLAVRNKRDRPPLKIRFFNPENALKNVPSDEENRENIILDEPATLGSFGLSIKENEDQKSDCTCLPKFLPFNNR